MVDFLVLVKQVLYAKLAGLNSNYIKTLSDNITKECLYNNQFSLVENISILFNFINNGKYIGHTVLSYQESLQSSCYVV